MRPNRHPARRHEQVGLEPALEGGPVRLLVVLDGREALGQRPRALELSGQHDAVRLVDLTRPEGLARRPELGPGREHGGARAAGALDCPDSRSGKSPDLSGAKASSRRDDLLSGLDIASARTNVLARLGTLRNLHTVVTLDNILNGDDGIGPVRNDAAGRDRHRLSGLEPALRRAAGRDPSDDGKRAGRVRRPDCEPVHRRARKRRKVDEGLDRLGDDPPRGFLDRNLVGRQRLDTLQDPRQRIVDRKQFIHGRA